MRFERHIQTAARESAPRYVSWSGRVSLRCNGAIRCLKWRQWAAHAACAVAQDMGVDHADVLAALEQMRGKGMPEGVAGDARSLNDRFMQVMLWDGCANDGQRQVVKGGLDGRPSGLPG